MDFLITVFNTSGVTGPQQVTLTDSLPGGVETVGIDAGGAAEFDPPFPAHYYLTGAGKYGVTQLANLGALPQTGALLIVTPLKLTGGTGSPVRALALVPQG